MKLYFYDFYGGEIKTRSEEYEEKITWRWNDGISRVLERKIENV